MSVLTAHTRSLNLPDQRFLVRIATANQAQQIVAVAKRMQNDIAFLFLARVAFSYHNFKICHYSPI